MKRNYASKEITFRISYTGLENSGKAENIQYISNKFPAKYKSELGKIGSGEPFDLRYCMIPLGLPKLNNWTTILDFTSALSQPEFITTRKFMMGSANAICFVIDSEEILKKENIEYLRDVESEFGEKESIPIVLQINNRAQFPRDQIEKEIKTLNKNNYPWIESDTDTGKGIFETLSILFPLILKQLKRLSTSNSGTQEELKQDQLNFINSKMELENKFKEVIEDLIKQNPPNTNQKKPKDKNTSPEVVSIKEKQIIANSQNKNIQGSDNRTVALAGLDKVVKDSGMNDARVESNQKATTSTNSILKTILPFSIIKSNLIEYVMSPERDNFIISINKKQKHIELWSVVKLQEYLKNPSTDKATLYRSCSFSISNGDGEEGILFIFLLNSFQYVRRFGNKIKDPEKLIILEEYFKKARDDRQSTSKKFKSAVRTLSGRIGNLFGEKNETTGREKSEYGEMLLEGSLQRKGLIYHVNPKDIFNE